MTRISVELVPRDVASLDADLALALHRHRAEAEGVRQITGLSKSDIVEHDSGDKVQVEMTPYDLTKGRINYRFK